MLTADSWEIFQKVVEVVPFLKVVHKCLHRHTRTSKDDCTTHEFLRPSDQRRWKRHLYLLMQRLEWPRKWGKSSIHPTNRNSPIYFPLFAMSSFTCFSTTVPLKKSGFMPVHSVVGLVKTKSRKSSSVITPCSTI